MYLEEFINTVGCRRAWDRHVAGVKEEDA